MRVKAAVDIQEMTDEEFLACLRQSTEEYLATVDAWERQFRMYYRVASPGPSSVPADLESLHRDYLDARQVFQACVPRARRLCQKYELRDPWQAMLHIHLGANTPQVAATTAVGRGERNLIIECIAALESALSEPTETPTKIPSAVRRGGFFQRVYDFFF